MNYDHRTENGYYPRNSRRHYDDDKKHPCMSSVCKWQPKKDYLLLQLIRESNIHGVKYTAQPDRHILERLFWIITILICSGVGLYLGYNAIAKLDQTPVIISFEPTQTPMAEVPFPAVTVCGVNRFRKSGFEMAMRMATNATLNETEESQHHALKFLGALDSICGSKDSFSVRFNYSLMETTVNLKNRGLLNFKEPENFNSEQIHTGLTDLNQALQTCNDMIPLCLWEGQAQNCSEIFDQVITDFGFCCTFNMMPLRVLSKLPDNDPRIESQNKLPEKVRKKWERYNKTYGFLEKSSHSKDANEDYPKHQSKAGQGSGLSFVLNPELDEYFCTGHVSKGFRIYAHPPISWPHVAEFGMAVAPDVESFLNIDAEINSAEQEIKGLSIKRRHCYFLGEYQLEFFQYYTAANCVDECVSRKIQEICKCIRYDLPQIWSEDTPICAKASLQCSDNVKKKIGNNGTTETCPHCLPSCSQIEYIAQSSSAPILDNTNIWEKEGGGLADWAGKSVSIVHVFFGSETVYARVRKNIFGFNELFASVGGIFGLFLGLSMMSVVEPLYFFIRLWYESKSEARNRAVTESKTSITTTTTRKDGRGFAEDLSGTYFNKTRGYSRTQIRRHPQLQFLN